MGLALVGLISFQMYWINNAINISEERFKQDVHEALNNVSVQLEQQEVVYTAAKKLQYYQKGHTIIGLDSIKFIDTNQHNDSSKLIISDEYIENIYFNDSMGKENGKNLDLSNKDKPFSPKTLIDKDVLVEIKRFQSRIDSIPDYENNIEKVQEKSQMVTVVLNELLSKERKIKNRIDKKQLEGLLSSALNNRGIDIDFFYGVIDGSSNTIILSNDKNQKNEYLKSEFNTHLFTRDIIPQEHFLSVYFPYQRTFLISKIWFSLASSILLVFVIILCFAYAIYTIIRQKKISEIKNDFINNMTHEFKTPISTVSLACEALQDEDVNANKSFVNRYISIIQAENNRLGLQVEKVLQMATLDKKDFKLKLEKIDIHEVIEKAISNIQLQIEKKNGKIVKNLEAKVPFVVTDHVHLTNIIYNLLDNANKYSGEKKPDISIKTFNSGEGISIRISDKGIGMTKDVVNRIFEKFYRVPTGNIHNVKGFGLGLAYVKTMIDALGGHINVNSVPDKGSTFEIYLSQHE